MSRRSEALALGVTLVLALADLGWVCVVLCPQAANATGSIDAPTRGHAPAGAPVDVPRGAHASLAPPQVATERPAPPPARATPPQREPTPALPDALLEPVPFATGSATLLPEARERVARAAIEVARHRGARIQVRGHADPRGIEEGNVRLSLARAVAVARELAALGVSADRIDAVGLGSTEPLDRADTPEAWRRNRRVELVWIR